MFGLLMCLHAFWVMVECKPYRTHSDNELSCAALFGTFLVLFAAQIIKLRSSYITRPDGDEKIGILLIIMMLSFPVYGTLLIIYDIYGPSSRSIEHGVTANLTREADESKRADQASTVLLKKGESAWDVDDGAYALWILEDPTERFPQDEKIKMRLKHDHVLVEMPFRRGDVGGEMVSIKWPYEKIAWYDGEKETDDVDMMQLFHIQVGDAKFSFEIEFADPIVHDLDAATAAMVPRGECQCSVLARVD